MAPPRKKTKPFTIPKTAKVKAIIKHNAEASPLLKLPLEVQTNIFTKSLGDREIHVKTPEKGQDVVRGNEPQGFMKALGTCRQIYTMAMPVFWSTNTFSFDHPATFAYWLKNRTAHQKRSLRSIQLTIDLRRAGMSLPLIDIKNLSGLRELRLTLCQVYDRTDIKECKRRYNSIDMLIINRLRGLESLAMLPVKTVEVSMTAPSPNRQNDIASNDIAGPLSQAEEQQFIDLVKRMLLDPDSTGTIARLEAQRSDYMRAH